MKFHKGSSIYIVMAACIFKNDEELLKLEQVLDSFAWAKGYRTPDKNREFKNSKMKDRHKEELFEQLKTIDFAVRTIFANKKFLYSPHLREDPNQMKAFLIKALLTSPYAHFTDATVIIDGSDLRAFGKSTRSYLENQTRWHCPGAIKLVEFRDSKTSRGLQLADLVAGTIFRGLNDKTFRQSSRWKQVKRRANSPDGTYWNFTIREEERDPF